MFDAIQARRSIRRYDPRPVEAMKIQQLQESMLRAPSSRNRKPWRFVFVTDPALLEALAHARAQYGEFIAQAPLAVVVCADPSASDCWIEDCSIATAFLQLAATELGLGTCWVQIRARLAADDRTSDVHVREILGIGDDMETLCVVAVGYPAEHKAPRDRLSLDWPKVEVR